MAPYETPEVTDYGTLLELTEASTFTNADSPAGIANTAYPLAS
jgi:hypothetical protein